MAVDFDAGLFKRERPFYDGLCRIMLGYARGDTGREVCQSREALVQALADDD